MRSREDWPIIKAFGWKRPSKKLEDKGFCVTFIIEDQIHAEWQGKYSTLPEALSELRRLAQIPWDQEPNRCPCTSWRTCGRSYEAIEYDTSVEPWQEINRTGTLEISYKGVVWSGDFDNGRLRAMNKKTKNMANISIKLEKLGRLNPPNTAETEE